jgi:hypothetical protein
MVPYQLKRHPFLFNPSWDYFGTQGYKTRKDVRRRYEEKKY